MLGVCNVHINFLCTVFMITTKPMNEAKDQDASKLTGVINQANTAQ